MIAEVIFVVSLIVCGCSLDAAFDSTESGIVWLALFVLMAVSALCMKER